MIDKTADENALRITNPTERPSLNQMVRAFSADLEAKYPGAEQMADVAIATNAYLLVQRHLRRRIVHRKEGKFECAHSLRASEQLSEALARLRGPEPAKPAPLSPRQQFEATMARLHGRDDSTTAPPSCPDSRSLSAARESTPDSAERSPEGIS